MDSDHFDIKAFFASVLILVLSFPIASCEKVVTLNESAYVVPEQLKLKSSTAQASRVIAELKGGDRVTITSRANADDGTPWVKVTDLSGESGWAESRYFVKERIAEESRRIAEQIKDIQTQAVGRSKATLKLRLTPDRSKDDNVATMLPSGTILEITGRERKPRPLNISGEVEAETPAGKTQDKTPEVKYDDWLLVRLKDYAVLPAGWIYGGSVALEIPSEIVYFSSGGRRITGWRKIATLHGDDSKTGEHYLVLERKILNTNERVDFDRMKVLAYDPVSRNYSTPFREDLSGRFPLTLKMEGTKGQFQINVIDKDNQSRQLTYRIEMLDGGKVKVWRPGKK